MTPAHLSKLLAILVLTAVTAYGQGMPAVNSQAAAIAAFRERTNAYVAQRKQLEHGLPSPTARDDRATTEHRQRTLADRVREARRDAKAGDLFGTAAPIIRAVVTKDTTLRSPRERAAEREEVPARHAPAVNDEYPDSAPLATVPPLLLKELPPLPEGLEYRFMERALILRDTAANVIADVLPDVLQRTSPKS